MINWDKPIEMDVNGNWLDAVLVYTIEKGKEVVGSSETRLIRYRGSDGYHYWWSEENSNFIRNKITKPKKLEAMHIQSAGMHIYAHIPHPINFVEGTMKKGPQKILIGTDPWVQFPQEEWDSMISEVFTQMVDLWNEKYGET